MVTGFQTSRVRKPNLNVDSAGQAPCTSAPSTPASTIRTSAAEQTVSARKTCSARASRRSCRLNGRVTADMPLFCRPDGLPVDPQCGRPLGLDHLHDTGRNRHIIELLGELLS